MHQAEVKAVQKAGPFGSILKVLEMKQSQFTVTARRACLSALESITSLVQDCIEALNLVANCNKLPHMRWTMFGIHIHGNEMADLLAKRGTTLSAGPIEDLPISAVNPKNTIKTHLYQNRSGKQYRKTTKIHSQTNQQRLKKQRSP
jgi:hypothetical protein